MLDLNQYVVYVVVGICLCVGFVIKYVVNNDKVNRYIPLIVAVLGLVLNVWVNHDITPDIVLGGLVSGLSSTGLYEAFKQFLKQ